MAFPTIPTVGAGRVVTGVDTAGGGTKTFPSLTGLTKNAGDLLIALCLEGVNSTPVGEFSSWGGGFTEFADRGLSPAGSPSFGCAYKFSTGSETGTFTVTTANTTSDDSAFFLLSIPGAHPSAAPEATLLSGGSSTSADPDELTPSWGAADTLWIAVGLCVETGTAGSFTGMASAPTNYTNYVDTGISADVLGGVEGAVAFRQLNAASENPGAFSNDTSNTLAAALVIAVRPIPNTSLLWNPYQAFQHTLVRKTRTLFIGGLPPKLAFRG